MQETTNLQWLTMAAVKDGELSIYPRFYYLGKLRQEMGEHLIKIYGQGNWLIIPTSDLPVDFSVDTYTIENGQLVPAPAEVVAERAKARQATEAAKEIAELRAYLTSTDYTAIKCGELGLSMVEAYPDIHAQRTAARARINELQEGGAE